MKFKTTKKAIREEYCSILGAGYCSILYLLYFTNPIAYSTRSEGWACDYYDIDGLCISTGYAPMNSKNVKVSYEFIDKYENMARDIISDYNIPYDERKKAVNELLHEFAKKVKESRYSNK